MVKGGKRTKRQRRSKKQRGGGGEGEVVTANNTPESDVSAVKPADTTAVAPKANKSWFSLPSWFGPTTLSKEQPQPVTPVVGGKRNKTSKRKKC